MTITAEWSYGSHAKHEGRIVNVRPNSDKLRLVVEPYADHSHDVFLEPDRLDNWDDIKGTVEKKFGLNGNDNNETISEEDDSVKLPRFSTKQGSKKWVGVDDDLEPMTDTYKKHGDLKDELNVVDVKRFRIDGKIYYDLTFHPETILEAER